MPALGAALGRTLHAAGHHSHGHRQLDEEHHEASSGHSHGHEPSPDGSLSECATQWLLLTSAAAYLLFTALHLAITVDPTGASAPRVGKSARVAIRLAASAFVGAPLLFHAALGALSVKPAAAMPFLVQWGADEEECSPSAAYTVACALFVAAALEAYGVRPKSALGTTSEGDLL